MQVYLASHIQVYLVIYIRNFYIALYAQLHSY